MVVESVGLVFSADVILGSGSWDGKANLNDESQKKKKLHKVKEVVSKSSLLNANLC